MSDISDNIKNPLTDWQGIGRATLGLYHIEHSRQNVPNPPGSVGEPRHLIVFRLADDAVIDILGIIHERMLPRRALLKILKQNADEA
jgi:hypothetical protein